MRNTGNSEGGRSSFTPFASANTENSGSDGTVTWAIVRKKMSFCTDMFGLLSPKTNSKSLLGLMNVSYRKGFAPGVVVW